MDCEGDFPLAARSTFRSSREVLGVSRDYSDGRFQDLADRESVAYTVSTGIRFTTIPSTPLNPAVHVSPPTTLTILYNPLMGFLSTSYAAQVTPHLALASRFGVNVYSYESDLCLGGEWWIGKGSGSWIGGKDKDKEVEDRIEEVDVGQWPSHPVVAAEQHRDGVLRAKVSGNGVSRDFRKFDAELRLISRSCSSEKTVSLLYESRIRHCLVSVGVISDLTSRASPVRAMGLEVQYFAE